jgi:hypothetical protein
MHYVSKNEGKIFKAFDEFVSCIINVNESTDHNCNGGDRLCL